MTFLLGIIIVILVALPMVKIKVPYGTWILIAIGVILVIVGLLGGKKVNNLGIEKRRIEEQARPDKA